MIMIIIIISKTHSKCRGGITNLQCEGSRDSEKQRRLPDRLGRMNCEPVICVGQVHSKIDGDIVESRDLIRAGTPREQLAGAVLP